MRSLQDFLFTEYGLELTGWTLFGASGISSDGLTIVGTGFHDGCAEGWIATLPDPSVVPLPGAVLLGFLGLAYSGLRLRRAVT
ncbi:MAG: hypothetical protein KBE65_20285 [Phycisphaerae bacterium]|nr:hypothetical protein [Phycisphaerae bacterium]